MTDLILKKECYNVVGLCMEVHNNLGPGFLEVVYKDALEHEFMLNGTSFVRERMYDVKYKGIILPHHFFADFVVYDRIILEIKAVKAIHEEAIAKAINYLAVSGLRLAIIVNFGEGKLNYQRIVR